MQLIQYKQLFLTEARAKLRSVEDAILILEKDARNIASVEEILHVLHTLKSDAATMSYLHLANAVHTVEDLFIAMKRGKHALDHRDIDNLFILVDAFRSDLDHIQEHNTEIDLGPAIAFIVRGSNDAPETDQRAARTKTTENHDDSYEPLGSFVELPIEKLDEALSSANDMVAANQQLQRMLATGDRGSATIAIHNLISKASDIREMVVNMKMIPLKQYFVFLARLVRDLARQQKKFISFEFKDNNLRFERQILEPLRDICVQLIRNAVDHGFHEGERGRVTISFEFKANAIHMSVTDNGHGIDWAQLLLRARALGITESLSSKLGNELKYHLLFELGVSSSPTASLVSGRGVGLVTVGSIVHRLHGAITFTSTTRGSGRGTRFEITIPQSPTLFRALTWRWGNYYLALPLFVVEKVIQLPGDTSGHSEKTYHYRGTKIPIADLAARLHLGADLTSAPAHTIAIVASEARRYALRLPARVSEQELIMTAMPSLAKFPTIAGVAVSEESLPIIIVNHRIFFE